MKKIVSLLALISAILLLPQRSYSQYWQQEVDYKMDIDFNVKSNQFSGKQTLIYTNNSPDTLYRAFYHLYFNAFQPGSMMDVRSRTISDPDSRVGDRISKLKDSEIGYHKIMDLKQDGAKCKYITEGTVLEVDLANPIPPKTTTTFQLSFESQVPLQIRRSGRDNKEGIEYSMSQWYPKIAEYDREGWHSHPYVGREFYAPWGNFEVNITIDSDYIIGGTGVLENANEIGYGYQDTGVEIEKRSKKQTWRFKAEKVHDFVWAADPDFVHKSVQMNNGPLLHFLYQENGKTEAWNELPELTVKAFDFIQQNFGEYPFPQYSVIQGGDGGMEYPMATLITGERNLKSLVGVTVHEALHSWYQGLLATNESYYAWMDEGFTTYATSMTMAEIFGEDNSRSQASNYKSYAYLATSGNEEPLSTHADHFNTNGAYGLGSYRKGAIALAQMNYLIGEALTARALKKYYYDWRFKHPDAKDWIRVFEKVSGLELNWYLEYWVNTTHTIDYAISSVTKEGKKTRVSLERVGKMPMPMEVTVTYTDGSKEIYYAPLSIMRGEKQFSTSQDVVLLPDWPWTNPTYSFTIDSPIEEVEEVVIDESDYLADVNIQNNYWEAK